jgi:hypothetical protein
MPYAYGSDAAKPGPEAAVANRKYAGVDSAAEMVTNRPPALSTVDGDGQRAAAKAAAAAVTVLRGGCRGPPARNIRFRTEDRVGSLSRTPGGGSGPFA